MKMKIKAIEKNKTSDLIFISLRRFWQVCSILTLFLLNGCLTENVILKGVSEI